VPACRKLDAVAVFTARLLPAPLITTYPTVINPATSIRDAARSMVTGHFWHLPVVGEAGLIGMVDITDVCAALARPAAG